MSRLIDAETAKEQVKLYFNKFARDGLKKEIIERATNDIAEVIDNVPTVVAELHGYWIGEGDGYADGEIVYDTWYCSNCDYVVEDDDEPNFKYCPNCGAKMDASGEK